MPMRLACINCTVQLIKCCSWWWTNDSPKHVEPFNEKIKTIHKNLCISLVYIYTEIWCTVHKTSKCLTSMDSCSKFVFHGGESNRDRRGAVWGCDVMWCALPWRLASRCHTSLVITSSSARLHQRVIVRFQSDIRILAQGKIRLSTNLG